MGLHMPAPDNRNRSDDPRRAANGMAGIDEAAAELQHWLMRRFSYLVILISAFASFGSRDLSAQDNGLPPGLARLVAPRPKLTAEEAVARAKGIILPKVQMKNVPAADVIMAIREKVMELTEGKPGVEIELTSGVAFAKPQALLNMDLKDVSLHAALEEIAKQANLVLTFESGAAGFWTQQEIADKKVILTEAQAALLKRADAIVLPKFDVQELALPEVIKLLNAQAKAADPQKRGVPIELSPTAAKAETKLTLALEGKTVSETLSYILNLANLRQKVTETKITLTSLGEK